jgi:hypothetical protein
MYVAAKAATHKELTLLSADFSPSLRSSASGEFQSACYPPCRHINRDNTGTKGFATLPGRGLLSALL